MHRTIGRLARVVLVFAFVTLFLVAANSLTSRFRHQPDFPEPHSEFHPGSDAEATGASHPVVEYNHHGIPIYHLTGTESPPIQLYDPASTAATPVPEPLEENSLIPVRPEHPRLFATEKSWRRLYDLIITDPYLRTWNQSIFQRASELLSLSPANYSIDGSLTGSGVLDVAREVQLRIKHWAFAYRITGNETWKDRIWQELVVASGNSTQYFGIQDDNWNSAHWLDVGEFIVAFAFAYDWLHDVWTPKEREAIMWTIISLGLKKGLEAHNNKNWFLSVRSNWNCVTNGGMIIGALAVYHDDPTGVSNELLPKAVKSALENCAQSVEPDGTWAETPDYWYFGTQAHAQLASALLTATGSTHRMLTANPAFKNTSLFHIYNYGMTEKFNYGDCGPAKLTATANSLLFYGDQLDTPLFTLYQRDRLDAADPLAMLWYNPRVAGTWHFGLPLDREFPSTEGAWVSMRSSWTDPSGLFVAMKAGKMTGHASHGNLDAGDFVVDAIGERWAGELCQDDYLADGYFSGEDQESKRWQYYRCRTEGQNTILHAGSNQVVNARPTTRFESSHTDPPIVGGHAATDGSTAFWIANLTEAYNGTRISRGLRLLNGRKRMLIQDEIDSTNDGSEWRMHTNATIAYDDSRKIARLTLNGKRMVIVLQSPTTATFHTVAASRQYDHPNPNGSTDLPNAGVSVLAIEVPPGASTVIVVFCPAWDEETDTRLPHAIPLAEWTLDSHSTV